MARRSLTLSVLKYPELSPAILRGLDRPRRGNGERGANTIHGSVAFVEKLGEASYLYVRLPDGQLITLRESGDTANKIDDPISVYLAPDSLHAFKQDGRACRRTVTIDSVQSALL